MNTCCNLHVVYIRSETNLADAPSHQRGLDMWSLHAVTEQDIHVTSRLKSRSPRGSRSPWCYTDPFSCRQGTLHQHDILSPILTTTSEMVERGENGNSSLARHRQKSTIHNERQVLEFENMSAAVIDRHERESGSRVQRNWDDWSGWDERENFHD